MCSLILRGLPACAGLHLDQRLCVQEASVLSDDNVFLKPYGVSDIVKDILRVANIVVAPELVMLAQPYSKPGTSQVPLAILDDDGQQVHVLLQLMPKQATVEQLQTHAKSAEKQAAQVASRASGALAPRSAAFQ